MKRSYTPIIYKIIDYNRQIKVFSASDFMIKEGLALTAAIQVTLSLKDEAVRKRELRGLAEAMETHKLNTGFIITENEHETITLDNRTIKVKPIHEWLME